MKKIFGKRGMSWMMEEISKAILLLFFVALVTVIIFEVKQGTVHGYDKAICKSTVLANSKLRIPGAQIEQVKVSCPTRYVTISLSEIEIESGEDTTKEDINCRKGIIFDKGTDNKTESKQCFLNKTNSAIAELIFDCWDQFGAGQIRVFSNYILDRQCMLCARIEFKKEVYDLFKSEVDDLPISMSRYKGDSIKDDFTLDNFMRSNAPRGHGITYYEFSLDQTDAFLFPYYDYSFDKPTAVVFVAQNKDALEIALGKGWTAFKAWWDETQPKEQEYFANTLEFIPYDEVVQKCEVIV